MAKSNSSTKKLIYLIVVIVVVLVAVAIIGRKAGWFGGNANAKEVETATAKLKTITQTVSASGTIEPVTEVKLSPEVSGEIIDLPIIDGEFVKKGQLLVRIKPDTYQADIDQLKATLLSQKAQLEKNRADMLQAKVNFEQQQELFKKGMISHLDFVSAKTGYQSAQAGFKASQYQIQNVEAQLRKAQEQLQKTIIRSPMTGTISGLNVETGERVVGSSMMAGTELMDIAKMDQMEVDVKVNENDIVNVAEGDTTDIDVDAYPDREFKGIVTQIANAATVSGQSTTEQVTEYLVKVKVLSPHNENAMKGGEMKKTESPESPSKKFVPVFKPGMTASVDIQTKTVNNVVAIPIQAVTVRDFSRLKKNTSGKNENKNGALAADKNSKAAKEDTSSSNGMLIPKEDLRKVVFKVVDGKAKMVEVKTGISDDSHIQIISGVNVGDQIVTGSYKILSKELSDGDPVRVNNKQFNMLEKK